ncbi:MAG: hypothetical protein WA916_01145 [Arcobacter sp.]|uniref:hypothetical protein n=1 Tax=Arcobacter sp. TaxID=1872629 RepID=UPI003C71A4D1
MKQAMPGYEKRKVAIDFFKHIATLSVACIAVIISFLPQLQQLEESKGIPTFAVICFLLSVISVIFSVSITLANIESLPKKHGTGLHKFHRLNSFISILGFLSGVGSLCWLIITNLV